VESRCGLWSGASLRRIYLISWPQIALLRATDGEGNPPTGDTPVTYSGDDVFVIRKLYFTLMVELIYKYSTKYNIFIDGIELFILIILLVFDLLIRFFYNDYDDQID
jgi:hypothetical protein